MNEPPASRSDESIGTTESGSTQVAVAAAELSRIQHQTEAARAVLIRLLQDVVEAESHLGSLQAEQLLEANEQLVVSALRAQTEAESAGRALNDASRSAELDALTRLPNRVLLLDRFANAIAAAKRRGGRMALLFLDLDNFKHINDTLGHAAGDEVLLRVAHCIASLVREADTVSRHGGDEFLILLTEVSQASDAVLVADKVLATLAEPSPTGGQVLSLSASIGISIYPDDGEDADLLINRADAAMYRAKRSGGGTALFRGDEQAGDAEAATAAGESPPQPLQASGLERLQKSLMDRQPPQLQPSLAQLELAHAVHERRHALMREANEQLTLAALGAKELQAAAERAQQRQTEFLALVANELRNPLQPIRIATAMLGRVRTDEPLLPRVTGLIERQLAQMSRLVGELLDVSRASAAPIALRRERIDMANLIRTAVAASRPEMKAREQEIDIRMPMPGSSGPTSAPEVEGDPARLAQVLGNLLNNASRFTEDGGAITLDARASGGSLVLTLSDSGVGITAEALPQVFEPFFQDAHALGLNGVGLGIGLTVVRELVEAHGGRVDASSAGRGQGSRFIVTLPLAGAARSTAASASPPAAA